jgi:hypothetical protein
VKDGYKKKLSTIFNSETHTQILEAPYIVATVCVPLKTTTEANNQRTL